jgi:hypothetical protein
LTLIRLSNIASNMTVPLLLSTPTRGNLEIVWGVQFGRFLLSREKDTTPHQEAIRLRWIPKVKKARPAPADRAEAC